VFTDLFRSPEFALNAGKLLNSLMEYSKRRDDISKIFNPYTMTEISKKRKSLMNDVERNKGG
jgi:hypothetical protein